MDSFLVGIDVSKALFSVAGIDSEGNESFSGSYPMDSGGFDEFLKTITSHCEDLSKIIIGWNQRDVITSISILFLPPGRSIRW